MTLRPSFWLIFGLSCFTVEVAYAQPAITWNPAVYELYTFPGTSTSATLKFTNSRQLSNISLFVVPEISQLLSIQQVGTIPILAAGQTASITTHIVIPSFMTLGLYQGTVHVRSNSATIPNTLKVLIHVVMPRPGVIPPGPAFPSQDRITTTSSGIVLVRDEVIVSLPFGLPNQDQIAISLATASKGIIIGSFPQLAIFQFRYNVANLAALEQVRLALQRSQYVEFAVLHWFALSSDVATSPNDPKFLEGSQWGLNYIHASEAWSQQTGSSSVVVGIIDRDFDPGHPDLRANVTTPLLPPPANPFNSGHGTHVAGISGAVGNNDLGVAGVMWKTSERLYDCAGPGTTGLDTLCVAGSMVAAAEEGVRVVNLSSSVPGADCGQSPPPDQYTLATAISAAQLSDKSMRYAAQIGKDVLWVFSAGNGCRDAMYESGPQAGSLLSNNGLGATLVVASVAKTGQLSLFSNFGGLVNVAAPGEDILSTVPRLCPFGIDQLCFANPSWGDLWATKSGTSQAAPFVSGLAGLVLSQHPTFSAAQIKQCIINAAQSAGTALPNQAFHVISAPEALQCATGHPALYVTDRSLNEIWGFIVTPNGALQTITGSPFGTGRYPASVTLHPSGKFLYTANIAAANLSAFSISPATGALTPITGSPIETGAYYVADVAAHPSGKFLYVSTSVGVVVLAIDALTGALTPIPGSPFEAGHEPYAVAIHPSGKFAYVSDPYGNDNNIRAFTIDQTTGALVPITGSPFPAGTTPLWMTVDPLGRFVYAANGDSLDISGYTVDAQTGALTPIPGSPFAGGASSIVVDPSGRFVYTGNGSNSVLAYSIDSQTGALTPIPGSPFAGGGFELAIDSSGSYLYSSRVKSSVTTFTINSTTGALSIFSQISLPDPYSLATSPGSLLP